MFDTVLDPVGIIGIGERAVVVIVVGAVLIIGETPKEVELLLVVVVVVVVLKLLGAVDVLEVLEVLVELGVGQGRLNP